LLEFCRILQPIRNHFPRSAKQVANWPKCEWG